MHTALTLPAFHHPPTPACIKQHVPCPPILLCLLLSSEFTSRCFFSLQTALMRSEELLDYVAAGKIGSYDEVRLELADAYKVAGLSDMANFIIATS